MLQIESLIGFINALKQPSTFCGLCNGKQGYITHHQDCILRIIIDFICQYFNTSMPILKTSATWLQELYPDTFIMDPDGWDRNNYRYSFEQEKITEDEFQRRLTASTIMYKIRS